MSKNHDNKEKERLPLKLLKNRSYPSYQLYAVVKNKKSPEEAMVISILETFSWLRKRFRDIKIPDEINYPEPDKYRNVKLDDFKSFHINEGYTVDVVFIKEKGVWAFHLIEPDLGPDPGNDNQRRKPVPGRLFATNIAFRIYNGKLECGFKTFCSEPIGTKASCEVFRLAVVKSMVQNKLLGLEQIIPIIREPHTINSYDKLDNFIKYIKSNERQLPFVLTIEYKDDINVLKKEKPDFDINHLLRPKLENLMSITNDAEKAEEPLEIKIRETATKRMGYAQFGFLAHKYIEYLNTQLGCNVSGGEVYVFYPEKYKHQSKIFNRKYIKLNEERFIKDLENELQEFPKYKNLNFGNIMFINEAQMEELKKIIDLSNSKEEIIVAIDDKIKRVELHYEDCISRLEDVIHEKEVKINRLKEELKEYENKINNKSMEIEKLKTAHSKEFNKLNKTIEWKEKKLKRPYKTEDIPEWVENQYKEKLIFHDRAKDLISKTPSNEVDVDLLCDAIEFLANEYRDERLNLISEQECNDICSAKYNRLFKATPNGDKSIEYYTTDYKVKYCNGASGKSKEVLLDQHLKIGNDSRYLIRIYFFFDTEKKLVVVGSLPKHLDAVYKKKY